MTSFPPPPPPPDNDGMTTTRKVVIGGALVLGGLVVGGALAGDNDETDDAAPNTSATTTTTESEAPASTTMSDADMLEEYVWPEFETEACAAVDEARAGGFSDTEIRQVVIEAFMDEYDDSASAERFWSLIQEEC